MQQCLRGSVYDAFAYATEIVHDLIPQQASYVIYGDQNPQMEDYTNGLRASKRGFGFGDGQTFGGEDGSFNGEESSLFTTPLLVSPLISDVLPISVYSGGVQTITAHVVDDEDAPLTVWAQIFPPSSEPSEDTDRDETVSSPVES